MRNNLRKIKYKNTKKFYLLVRGKDNAQMFYFSRTSNSLVYGIKSSQNKEIEKLYSSYHLDGGGRFFGKSNKRDLLTWDKNNKIPLIGGTFGLCYTTKNNLSKKVYKLKLQDNLTALQYNLWLIKPPFIGINDLPKSKIKIFGDLLIKEWKDQEIYIYIVVFKPI